MLMIGYLYEHNGIDFIVVSHQIILKV
jgi:hypothetical protein